MSKLRQRRGGACLRSRPWGNLQAKPRSHSSVLLPIQPCFLANQVGQTPLPPPAPQLPGLLGLLESPLSLLLFTPATSPASNNQPGKNGSLGDLPWSF